MTQDFIAFGTLGGTHAGLPGQISKAFAEYLENKDKADSWQRFLDYIKWYIECFVQWACRHADGDTVLLGEIDDYAEKLYDWIGAGKKSGKLDELEHTRLAARKQRLTEKLRDHIPARLIDGGQDSINELLNRVEHEVRIEHYPYDPSGKWFNAEIQRLSLAAETVKLTSRLIEKIYPVGREKSLYWYNLFEVVGEIASYTGLLEACRDSCDWKRIDRGIGDHKKRLERLLSEIREIRRAEDTPESAETEQEDLGDDKNDSRRPKPEGASKQTDIPRWCAQIADDLEECCLIIDESGRQTKNEMFQFTASISRTEDVKDSELYDIDTEKLESILYWDLKNVLPYLRQHLSTNNVQNIEKIFRQIKKWAVDLLVSTPRPSIQRYPRMADYPFLVIERIAHLTSQLPEAANELRRVAGLLREIQEPATTRQRMDKQESNDWQLDIAVKMRDLVSLPPNMDFVREQDRAFYKKYKAWKKQNDAYDQEAQRRDDEGEDAHVARIEQIKKPKPNPCDWLALPEHYTNSHAAHAAALTKELLDIKPPSSLKPQQALMSACVLLTLLHDDKFKDDPRTEQINNDVWPVDEDWAKEKQQELREKVASEEVQFAIDHALELVEAELPGEPAEPEQERKEADDSGGENDPKVHKVTASVITSQFNVTKRTLRRYVKKKKLIDYRPKGHAPKDEVILDAVKCAGYFTRRERP